MKRALGFVHDSQAYMRGRLENTLGLYETKWYVCPDCHRNQRLSKEDCAEGKAKCACGRVITEDDRRKYVKDRTQQEVCS